MQIQVNELKADFLVLHTKNVEWHVLNSLRRLIIAEYETLAIDEVCITENTSICYDDYVIDRFYMLPIKPLRENIQTCLIETKIKNETNRRLNLYSHDLIYDHSLIFIEPNIPIMTLNPQEMFEAKLIVKKGKGKAHAKFMPQTIITFKPLPIVKLKRELLTTKQKTDIFAICPRKVFDKDLNVVNAQNCNFCKNCLLQDIEDSVITISKNEKEILFTLETANTIDPLYLMKHATFLFKKKAIDFLQILSTNLD